MLYEALYVPPGKNKPQKDIINQPELLRYINKFGRKGDLCLVAEMNKKLIGAVWVRVFSEKEKGYGFADKETPELSMALYEEYRGKGIGNLLLKKILQRLTSLKYKKVSLSVDKRNYAYNFYRKNGFINYKSEGNSATMIKVLT